MKEVKVKVYLFDELEEAVKTRLINKGREVIEEDRCYLLSNTLYEELDNKYNLSKSDVELSFSLSSSQGDGVSFEMDDMLNYNNIKNEIDCSVFDNYILDKYKNTDLFDEVLEIIKEMKFSLKRVNFQYSHLYTCKIYDEEKEENASFYLNQSFITQLKNELYYVYMDICKYMERYGYNYIYVSDDEVIEEIRFEGNYFFKNGEVYWSY